MSKLVTVSGVLDVLGDVNTGQSLATKQLSLGNTCQNGGKYYQAVVCNQLDLATAGLVGAAFEDLEAVSELTQIELLYLKSTAEIALRLYAIPASVLAIGGAYPSLFAGGETLVMSIDGVGVTTEFDVLDQTIDQCVARINASMAFSGLATPRATIVGGQILITGLSTAVGASGVGQLLIGGVASIQLGFTLAVPVDAQGQDSYHNGLVLLEFPTAGVNLLTAIQISGVATVDVLAAGRSQ